MRKFMLVWTLLAMLWCAVWGIHSIIMEGYFEAVFFIACFGINALCFIFWRTQNA